MWTATGCPTPTARPCTSARSASLPMWPGRHAAKHYRFAIICAPSGAYYAEGLDPVRIYVEDEYIRAAPA